MSCVGSLRYNIGLKCKYAKILLTTKMIQHSKSMKKTRINAISNKKNDAEYFYDTVWCDFASYVNFTAQLQNLW